MKEGTLDLKASMRGDARRLRAAAWRGVGLAAPQLHPPPAPALSAGQTA